REDYVGNLVLERLFVSLPKQKPENSIAFWKLVNTIAFRALLDLKRRTRRDRESSSLGDEPDAVLAKCKKANNRAKAGANVGQRLEHTELRELIDNATTWLTDKQREVISLRLKGLRIKDIAEDVGRTMESVKQCFRDAKKKLGEFEPLKRLG